MRNVGNAYFVSLAVSSDRPAVLPPLDQLKIEKRITDLDSNDNKT
jgi:hypothetical protein